MQTGFNTNIHHRAVLFHVQSEDSGRAHPHIMSLTDLFPGLDHPDLEAAFKNA